MITVAAQLAGNCGFVQLFFGASLTQVEGRVAYPTGSPPALDKEKFAHHYLNGSSNEP